MAVKLVLLFLLIAGVFAPQNSAVRAEDQDDAESYDEVEEMDAEVRGLEDDMEMLDDGGKDEVREFCADPDNSDDPVCKFKM